MDGTSPKGQLRFKYITLHPYCAKDQVRFKKILISEYGYNEVAVINLAKSC
ncbi:hypothetical protein UACE39S_04169 [Ureibacillus acetophenoni]